MDIEDAIKRVKYLNRTISILKEAITKNKEMSYVDYEKFTNPNLIVSNALTINLGKETTIVLLKTELDSYKKELSKIQPIIDIANLALKNI